MKVEIGNKGLENSWQEPFPDKVECIHCGGVSRPAVSIMEEESGISESRPAGVTTLWPHDSTAFTVYLCLSCLKPTALFNQA